MPEVAEQNKTLKYLIWGLVLAGIIILIYSWVLKPKPLSLPPTPRPFPFVKIDLEFLESQEVRDMLPFEEISLPEEIGRENPFEAY